MRGSARRQPKREPPLRGGGRVREPVRPRPGAAVRVRASACERRRAQPRARPPVLLARRREDVEHDAAHTETAPTVGHVRRRLPEIAGLDVMLDAVLDADPLALEADAPLLVGVRVHRRHRAGLERDHGEHRMHTGEHARAHAGRELPLDAARLQIVEARDVVHERLLSRTFLDHFTARLVGGTASARTTLDHFTARLVGGTASARTTIHVATRHPTHYTMPRCSVARHGPSPISRRNAMPSPAFCATDFKVFDAPAFRARMGAIRERIRPKLEAVGHSLTPAVSRATGGDAFAHVAKHARRTVNPPDDTWVAFGPDARGYKKHCHFKVAVSRRAVRF